MPPKKTTKPKSVTPTTSAKYNATDTKYLIIVESPSKCKKIEDYLGDDYQCIASKGHIRHIDGLKSIDTKNNYHITFSLIEEKQSHIESMRKIITLYPSENIYLASDDDREGEAIAWHICQTFNLPVSTTKRILFHEITKPAIQAAVANPTIINLSLVYAQHARQVLDIIVGYKVSPTLWKHIHNNKSNGLSAGRCQTPALKLVYENEKNGTDELTVKYKVRGFFFPAHLRFDLNTDFESSEQVEVFLNKSKSHKHNLKIQKMKAVSKSPPKPFTTSQLLQTASNLYHYSPKTTMDLCQQLYQAGLITYMRTDSAKYSPIFLKTVTDYILKEYTKPEYVGNHASIVNGEASNPHEAIRVTNLHMSYISDENKMLANMYRLIWKNTVESCMSPATYNVTPIHISAPDDSNYIHNIEICTFLGWKRVSVSDNTEETNTFGGHLFRCQSLEKSGEPVQYNCIESAISVQNKHSHYTEASLIQMLEDLGIGRPSTYASIVSTIQDRGYVKKQDLEGKEIECMEYTLRDNKIEKTALKKVFGNEKNKLIIQSIGIVSVEFLTTHFQTLFNYDYTKQMELDLDTISSLTFEEAEIEWYKTCDKCSTEIKTMLKPLANLTKKTYAIGDNYELIFHQYGASLRREDDNGEMVYRSIKKGLNIDLHKLERGEYSLGDLLEIEQEHLGMYEDEPVLLKSGKYGGYIVWNGVNISVNKLKKPLSEITIKDVMPFILHHNLAKTGNTSVEGLENVAASPHVASANVLRDLTSELSIRKGKFGAYIFYKTASMGTPQFFNLKKFRQGFNTCSKDTLIGWIRDTYNLSV
jgi:DNA topoisomerase-1